MYCPFRREIRNVVNEKSCNFKPCYGNNCMAYCNGKCLLITGNSTNTTPTRIEIEDAHYMKDF